MQRHADGRTRHGNTAVPLSTRSSKSCGRKRTPEAAGRHSTQLRPPANIDGDLSADIRETRTRVRSLAAAASFGRESTPSASQPFFRANVTTRDCCLVSSLSEHDEADVSLTARKPTASRGGHSPAFGSRSHHVEETAPHRPYADGGSRGLSA